MRWLLLVVLLTSCRDTRTVADGIPPEKRIVVLLPETIKGVLDPRLNTRAWPAKIIHLVYEGVVSVHNAQGEPRPALAERIDQPSPAVYEITLRTNATFQDGQPVTADDVLATYESVRNPELRSPFRGLYKRVKSMEVLGPKRLQITLDAPHAPFLSDMSMGILPRTAMGPDGRLTGNAVGAGPYRIHAREGEREVLLKRHENYWRGTPKTPFLVFRTVSDQNTRVLALLGGAADLAQNAVTPRMADALRDRPDLVVETAPGASYSYVAYNLKRPALSDVRVRRALFLALNRERLITHKFRGTATLATGLLPTNHWAYNAKVRRHPYDPVQAQKLLDDAGFPQPKNGPRLSLTLKVSADKFRRNLAVLMAHDWQAIGVDVKVQPLETGTMLADVKAGNFDLYALQWQGGGEPHFYNWIFHSDRIPTPKAPNRGGNRGAYVNAEVDRLIEAGRATAKIAERRPIYARIQEILAEDVPYLSLWHEDVNTVRRKGLNGYQALPNTTMYPLWSTGWRNSILKTRK